MTKNIRLLPMIIWILSFPIGSAYAVPCANVLSESGAGNQIRKQIKLNLSYEAIQYQTFAIINALATAMTSQDEKTRVAGYNMMSVLMYGYKFRDKVAYDMSSGKSVVDVEAALVASYPGVFAHLGRVVIDRLECTASNGVSIKQIGKAKYPENTGDYESIPVTVKLGSIERAASITSFYVGPKPNASGAYLQGGSWNAKMNMIMKNAIGGDVEQYTVGLNLDPYNYDLQNTTGDLLKSTTYQGDVRLADLICKAQLSLLKPIVSGFNN